MFDEQQQATVLRPKRRRPTAAEKKRRRLIVFGAAGAAIVVIAVVTVVGYALGGVLVRHADAAAIGQAKVCAGIQAAVDSHAADDPQDPSEAQSLSIALEWRSQMSVFEGQLSNGSLKTTLQKYVAGLNATIAYYRAHPNLDMSNQPAQLSDLENTFTTDGEQARAICSG